MSQELIELTKSIGDKVDAMKKESAEKADSLKGDVTKQMETVKADAAKEIAAVKEDAAKQIEAVKTEAATNLEKAKSDLSIELGKEVAALKKTNIIGAKEKTFNDNLKEAITENFDKIKNMGVGEDLRFSMKAAGDMTFANNFSSNGSFTTDVRNQLFPMMREQVWLSDILPQGATNGATVTFPQETGGEGDVAVWERANDNSTGKPVLDSDFAPITVPVKWLAGIVRVAREMLDDLDWLNSFVGQRMLLSLKKAENNFILNGATGVTGLIAAAQAYDGTYTEAVKRIVDASFGQIVENDHYPTHTVLRPRDAVAIGLNQAEGSGEFDLPDGVVKFNAGRLQVAGNDVVTTKAIAANNFLSFDRNGAMFITRLQPELRVFEQNKDDVEKNMVTFRIEERATLIIPYPKAFVKGLLTPTT